MRSAESLVEKEDPGFKVDLRIEGSAQDVILEDEENGSISKSGGKYKMVMPSLIEDLGKAEKSIKFSEESSRTIH